MEATLDALRWVALLLYVVLALRAWHLRRQHTGPATTWLLATFGVLAGVTTTARLAELAAVDSELLLRFLITVLALYPFTLVRFARTFRAATASIPWRLDLAVLLLVVAATLAVPDVPTDADPAASSVWGAYLALFVGYWVAMSGYAAWTLWRAGNVSAPVVRARMRVLAVAAVLLSLTLVANAASGSSSAGSLAAQVLSLLAAATFLLGFATPAALRAAWRAPAEQALQRASVDLMRTETPQEIVELLLPHVATIVGAPSARVTADGTVVAAHGRPFDGQTTETIDLAAGTLELAVGPSAPLFGDEEQRVVRHLGLLADLALERARLLQSERDARAGLEVAMQQLRAANEEMEAFVYTASHDLKNPLIAVLSYLEILEDDYASRLDEDGRRYLERMRVNARFMDQLIGDLLALSRVGRVEVEPEEVDLHELAEDVATELRATEPRATIEVGELPCLWLNRTRARQLLQNLVGNALEHAARDDVTVRVEGHDEPGRYVVRVVDDGVGIPQEHRERVFGVFERLSVEETSSGTGIGLAICAKYVNSVGGTIWAERRDRGADIRIAFPEELVRGRVRAPLPGDAS